MKFMCKNCNYRFESEKDQVGKKCPYCGENTVIKEPDAEGILKDIE